MAQTKSIEQVEVRCTWKRLTCCVPALKCLAPILFSSLCVTVTFATTKTAMGLTKILQSFPLQRKVSVFYRWQLTHQAVHVSCKVSLVAFWLS